VGRGRTLACRSAKLIDILPRRPPAPRENEPEPPQCEEDYRSGEEREDQDLETSSGKRTARILKT
jgi:hypothetical protein